MGEGAQTADERTQMTTFHELCAEFHLTDTYENKQQAHDLIAWCHHYISKDLHFFGEPEGQYKRYLALAKHYLDVFLPQNATAFHPLTALQYAAQEGYHYFIAAHPANINEPTEKGMSPLHLAAVKGHVHTVETLLACDANPRMTNTDGQRPIHSALFLPAFRGSDLLPKKEQIFRLLLGYAPDSVEKKDASGNTLFHYLAQHGLLNLLKDTLDSHPAGAFYCNDQSQYPIHTAILNRHHDIAKILLAIDGVATQADNTGQTALHYAARYGDEAMLQCCGEKSLSYNIRDREDNTPLLTAAKYGRLDAVKALAVRGADTKVVSRQGWSLLHYAAHSDSFPLVLWVLEQTTPDVNHENREGLTALNCTHNDAIIALLRQHGARERHTVSP